MAGATARLKSCSGRLGSSESGGSRPGGVEGGGRTTGCIEISCVCGGGCPAG